MLLCLGELPVRFLWCCCCSFHFWSSFVVVVLHLLMFFIRIFFSTLSLTLPWTIAKFLQPFYIFSPAHRRMICNTFIFNHSFIFLPQAPRAWVGIFYPQTFSTLRSFTNILTCVNQRFSGSRRYFLEVFRASYWWSSKHRPNQSVCLIHSNPQSNNQNDSVLNSTIYWHELLVVKF